MAKSACKPRADFTQIGAKVENKCDRKDRFCHKEPPNKHSIKYRDVIQVLLCIICPGSPMEMFCQKTSKLLQRRKQATAYRQPPVDFAGYT